MTLVISCSTERYALIASDMRLTDSHGSVVHSETNKIMSWEGRFLMGFSGLAMIPKPGRTWDLAATDWWTADALVKVKVDRPNKTLPQEFADRATASFQRLRGAAYTPVVRRHAWLAVGFNLSPEYWPDSGDAAPATWLVSNALDDLGLEWRPTAGQSFRPMAFTYDPAANHCLVRAVGTSRPDAVPRMRAEMNGILASDPDDYLAVLDVMINEIRDTAQQTSAVGLEVLGAALPVAARGVTRMALQALEQPLRAQTSFYVSDTGELKFFTPMMVTQWGTLGQGSVEYGDPKSGS